RPVGGGGDLAGARAAAERLGDPAFVLDRLVVELARSLAGRLVVVARDDEPDAGARRAHGDEPHPAVGERADVGARPPERLLLEPALVLPVVPEGDVLKEGRRLDLDAHRAPEDADVAARVDVVTRRDATAVLRDDAGDAVAVAFD